MADPLTFRKVARIWIIRNNSETMITLTADIVSAPRQHNSVAVSDLPLADRNVHTRVVGLGNAMKSRRQQEPKVSIRSSIKPITSFVSRKQKLKMLKRHLMTHYNMTPDEYRQKWGLNADYPMVAPNYAEQRRALAKKIGLGTKRRRAARK